MLRPVTDPTTIANSCGESAVPWDSLPSSDAFLQWAYWLALAIVLVVPWPYGCIPSWTHPWLIGALGMAALFWVIGAIASRRTPLVPRPLGIGVTLLLVHGWILIANAQYSYDRLQLQFVPAHPWLVAAWAPGAVDTMDALPAMQRITGLLALLCIVTDMATHVLWRRRLLFTMLLSGLALTSYGLLQRVLHLPMILWEERDLSHNLFASFYYHGNAGAFVNLLVPLLIGRAALAFCDRGAHFAHSVAAVSLALVLAASVAVASKAASAVACLLVVSTAYATIRLLKIRQKWPVTENRTLLISAAALTILGAVLFGFERAAARWSELPVSLRLESPRPIAWQVCLSMLPDAGAWGIGPGNFLITFPHYTNNVQGISGVWEHAHQDYLQTWIEWGWVGLMLWAFLFGGAIWRAFRTWPTPSTRQSIEQLCTGIALGGVLIHALVDFPLQIAAIQVYVVALLGLLWSSPAAEQGASRAA